jgi:hypothetical protein
MYLTLKGIPVDSPPPNGENYFRLNHAGIWFANDGDLSADVDDCCVRIHDALAGKIFNGIQNYHATLPHEPIFLASAGLNSESTTSRAVFEKAIAASDDSGLTHRSLYLYDCQMLVSGIQECSKEVRLLLGEFYRSLNLDSLSPTSISDSDGFRWVTSPTVTRLHATLGFIYIRLHSLLDYLTKLCFEAENLRSDFSQYPRLASSGVMFGDRKRLKQVRLPGTIFEYEDIVREVELFRNQIIHSGLLDDLPKVYTETHSGTIVQKFILLPDRSSSGAFEKYKNRFLFYAREDKINERLPLLVNSFQERQIATLVEILRLL